MVITRHEQGVRAEVGAVVSQVHPVFMLPPLGASLFGSSLSGGLTPESAVLHVAAIFCAVYTAHVKDGLVDFHVRGEDDDHPVSRQGCRLLLVGSTAGFGLCLLGLWLTAGIGTALFTLPTWVIGYLHAPQLDTNPVTTTGGYPMGIAIAILSGAYAQTQTVSLLALSSASVFLLVLSGIKIIDDSQDIAYDRSIRKRTVAVVLGLERARRTAFGLVTAGLVTTVVLIAGAVFPPSALAAVVVFGAVVVSASRLDATLATMVLVRGSYLFLCLLFLALWLQPLAGRSLERGLL